MKIATLKVQNIAERDLKTVNKWRDIPCSWIRTRSPNYGPGFKSSLLPIFVNKILLKQNHAHIFMPSLGLLPGYNGIAE